MEHVVISDTAEFSLDTVAVFDVGRYKKMTHIDAVNIQNIKYCRIAIAVKKLQGAPPPSEKMHTN